MVFRCLTSDWKEEACGYDGYADKTYRYYSKSKISTNGKLQVYMKSTWSKKAGTETTHAEERLMACGDECLPRCDIMCAFHGGSLTDYGCNARWTTHKAQSDCRRAVAKWFGCPDACGGTPRKVCGGIAPPLARSPAASTPPSPPPPAPPPAPVQAVKSVVSATGLKFSVNSGTGNKCERGVPITTEAECKAVAQQKAKLMWKQSGKWHYAPKGCFLYDAPTTSIAACTSTNIGREAHTGIITRCVNHHHRRHQRRHQRRQQRVGDGQVDGGSSDARRKTCTRIE